MVEGPSGQLTGEFQGVREDSARQLEKLSKLGGRLWIPSAPRTSSLRTPPPLPLNPSFYALRPEL